MLILKNKLPNPALNSDVEMGSDLDNGHFRITQRSTRRLKLRRSWRSEVEALVILSLNEATQTVDLVKKLVALNHLSCRCHGYFTAKS